MNPTDFDPFAAKLRAAFEHSVSGSGTTFILFAHPRAPSLLLTRNPVLLPQVVPAVLAGTLFGGEEANTQLGVELSKAGNGWLPLFSSINDGAGFHAVLAPFLFYRAPEHGTFREVARAACEELGERGVLTGWCFVHCGITYLTKDGRFHESKDYSTPLWDEVEEAQPWVN